MSIKGRPYTWFEQGLESGSLAQVRAAAAELDRISLADALRVLVLIAAQEAESYDRAACRPPPRRPTLTSRGLMNDPGDTCETCKLMWAP